MLKEKLMKHLAKKGKKIEDDGESDAKMHVLNSLRDQADEAMKEKMGGALKKISVASDSEEGLEEGLKHAKDMVAKHHVGNEVENAKQFEEGSPEEEASERAEEEAAEPDTDQELEEHEMLSPEELHAKIEKLKELHAKKLSEQHKK